MKKLLIIIISISAASTLYAQTETTGSSVTPDKVIYKQSAGNNSLELALNPFSSGDIFRIPAGFGIRYRKFNSENFAFRLGVDLSFANVVDITQQKDDATNRLELRDKYNQFGITLRPGFEKHLLSSDRLSPYFGGEVIVGWNTSTQKEERQVATAIEESVLKNGFASNGMTFGVGGIAGVDFYIAKQLYLGFELGYAITYFSRATEKLTDYDGTETLFKNGSIFSVAPQAFGSFRVGYLF